LIPAVTHTSYWWCQKGHLAKMLLCSRRKSNLAGMSEQSRKAVC